MDQLTKTEQIFLSLLSNALFNGSVEIPRDVDWKAVICEAQAQAVLPLAFHKLDMHPIEMQSEMKKQTMAVIAHNVKVEWNHTHTHELMTNAKIPYVILKGCASAHYYPEPAYRMLGDVDFLVSEEYLERADEVLREDGFTPWKENHICHIVYRKPGAHLELHFEVAGMPEGRAGEQVRACMDDIFVTAVEVETDVGKLVLPNDFHHGLILLLHTCHHLTGEGIGLRHLCDWAVFVNHLANDTFKTLFEERLKAIGLWRFAQLLTQLSAKYLGMPEKEWANENIDDSLLEAVICDIFHGGNFGVKDKQRSHETMFISSRGKSGVGNSTIAQQFILSMNRIVYTKWPVSKKLKILLPFGWIFYGCRHLARVITGKRSAIHMKKVVSDAKERREVYKAFHLYEI